MVVVKVWVKARNFRSYYALFLAICNYIMNIKYMGAKKDIYVYFFLYILSRLNGLTEELDELKEKVNAL